MGSTLTNLLYHSVFSTKIRREMITPELADELFPYIGGIIRNEKGRLITIGGMPDHVHLLARFPPSISVSDMLRKIKSNSSKFANTKQLGTHFQWQRGYAAFSVSESAVEQVSNYIANQAGHHKKMSFKDELRLLLKKHHVEYDERYIWD